MKNKTLNIIKNVAISLVAPVIMNSCGNGNDKTANEPYKDPSEKYELLADSVVMETLSKDHIEMRQVDAVTRRVLNGTKVYDFRQSYKTELTIIVARTDKGFSYKEPLNENKPEVKVAKEKMTSLMNLKK